MSVIEKWAKFFEASPPILGQDSTALDEKSSLPAPYHTLFGSAVNETANTARLSYTNTRGKNVSKPRDTWQTYAFYAALAVGTYYIMKGVRK